MLQDAVGTCQGLMSRLAVLCVAIFGVAALGGAMPELTPRAMAGEPVRGIEDLVPKLLPAVVNIFNTRFPDASVPQGASDPADRRRRNPGVVSDRVSSSIPTASSSPMRM